MNQLKKKALAKKLKTQKKIFPKIEKIELSKCYLDISIENEFIGKMIIELRNDIVPRTCNNFYQLCENQTYLNCPFHRIIPHFMAQGGDFTNKNGTGGKSIYGEKFNDENFILNHDTRGVLSMANSGENTNGSQFFICFDKCDWLNGRHVVFGKVIDGLDILDKIEELGQPDGTPSKDIVISNCGTIK